MLGETHMLLVHLLRNDSMSSTLSIGLVALVAREGSVPVRADAVVALLRDLLVLLPEEVGFRAKHPGDTDESEEQKEDLERSLARVELVFGEDLEGEG